MTGSFILAEHIAFSVLVNTEFERIPVLGESAISMLKWHDLVGYPVPTPQSISQYWEKWYSHPKWDQMVESNRPNPTHNFPIIATCLPVKYLVNMVTYEINLRVCFIVTLTWDQYNQICQTSPAHSPCTIPYFCACWSCWAMDLAKESWPLYVAMILVVPKFQKSPPPGARASDSSLKCFFLCTRVC